MTRCFGMVSQRVPGGLNPVGLEEACAGDGTRNTRQPADDREVDGRPRPRSGPGQDAGETPSSGAGRGDTGWSSREEASTWRQGGEESERARDELVRRSQVEQAAHGEEMPRMVPRSRIDDSAPDTLSGVRGAGGTCERVECLGTPAANVRRVARSS